MQVFDQGKGIVKKLLVWWCVGIALSACAPEVVERNNAGNSYFDQAAYSAAIEEYRMAQVDDPDQAEPYYNSSNAYNRQAQLDATVLHAQQALRSADPDLAARTWYNLGNAFYDAQRWADAIAAYQENLRITPDDADAKHNLELALRRQEEQQSREELQATESEQPQEQQENQQTEDGDQSEIGAESQAPTSSSEASQAPGTEPSRTSDTQDANSMTPEQAMQLLRALVGTGETLQERLQEVYRVPGPSPQQDW